MAAAVASGFDLALDAAPLFSVPGRTPEWPWRAPGGLDRAGPGAAPRRLYAPSALHEACRRGDVDAVTAALDAGADVDAADEARPARHAARQLQGSDCNACQGGHTLLHFAAGFEQLAVTALLLERGAALELRDKARRAEAAPPVASFASRSRRAVRNTAVGQSACGLGAAGRGARRGGDAAALRHNARLRRRPRGGGPSLDVRGALPRRDNRRDGGPAGGADRSSGGPPGLHGES